MLLHTRQLLQSWDHAKSQALASHQAIQGYFTLGCHSTIAIHMLPEFLSTLLIEHPKLEINLTHNISRKIVEQIITMSVDIGIVANPFKHPDLIIRKLCDDETTFWTSGNHKSLQDINSKNALLICDPNIPQTEALVKKCKRSGVHFNGILTTESLEVVASLTAHHCGIGIIPSRVAQSLFPTKLKRIPNAPTFRDELCLVYRHENRNIVGIQTIINAIKHAFVP